MRNQAVLLLITFGLIAGAAAGRAPVEQRHQLEPKALKFVFEVAALEPAILVPRLDFPTTGVPPTWRVKVCPHVAGLSEQQEQYVLARIAQIAQAAGVPLGDKNCSPNVYVIVTAQPRQLLKRMDQNSNAMFGSRGRPYLINQFIATPRPIRVWYNVIMGRPASLGFEFAGVIIIADQTQLKTVSLGQLADYLAMVSLAEIKPGAHPYDARSILTLFHAGTQVAPAQLTDWDQAFLKSLYSSWQRSLDNECGLYRCSLDRIAMTMANQLAP